MATPKLTLEEQIAQSKLRALAQGVRIWKLEGSITPMYAVPSSSMDGTAYLLEIHNPDNNDITCTCPGHVYRGVCKHVGAVMLALDAAAQMELATSTANEERAQADLPDNVLADING